MRKSGKRNLALALSVAMTMGTAITAYAGPGTESGDSVSTSNGVITAGQGHTTESGGPGEAGIGNAQQAASGQPSQENPDSQPPQENTAEQPAGHNTSQRPQEKPAAPAGDQNINQQGQPEFLPSETAPVAGAVENGVLLEKTVGNNNQITNLSMKLNGVNGAISYGVYVNNGGYLPWKGNGVAAGGTEASTYIEAIQVALTGEAAKLYNVYYRGTSAYAGQHGWACNEELMGTVDRGDYLVSIEVVLMPKEAGAPGSYERRFFSNHSEYIRIAEGNTTYINAEGAGHTGWVDHDRARYYFKDGRAVTGWNYIDGMKFFFNDNGALIMDVDAHIGRQDSYQLRVNKELNCLTVFAKDGDNGYIIPVKAMLTSVGDDTPVGTFKTPEKYRWRFMVNDTYTQYATRIIAGQGFLFHSITYEKTDPNTLITSGYNNLGVTRSLGCIRLTCANAKWVYDNCKIGTEVVIYNDASTPGPFFKPYQVWIPEDQTWDPTDPAFAGR